MTMMSMMSMRAMMAMVATMLPEILEELEWELALIFSLSNIPHFKKIVRMLNSRLTVLAEVEGRAF
jgi:hypothetical protein